MQLHPLIKFLIPQIPNPPSPIIQNFRIGKSMLDGNLWILGSAQPNLHALEYKSTPSPKILTTIPILFSKLNQWIGSLKLSLSPQIQHSLLHFLEIKECDEEKISESISNQLQQAGIQNFFPHAQTPTPVVVSETLPTNSISQSRGARPCAPTVQHPFFHKNLKANLPSLGGILILLLLIFWFAT